MENFEKLLKLNVSDKVEEKAGLKYLSWAWAWSEFKKIYPNAEYEVRLFNGKPYIYDELTGFMVFTEVCVDDLKHEMWLPVMDGNNKAMKSEAYTYSVKEYKWDEVKKKSIATGKYIDKTVEAATMFDINKTIMRCLTKNLAMFGLGLYIYAGEDLPEGEEEKPQKEQKKPVSENVYNDNEIDSIADKEAEQTFNCSDCGKSISVKVANFSKMKFDKPLCMDCQNKLKREAMKSA